MFSVPMYYSNEAHFGDSDVSDFVDFVEYMQLQGRKFASAVDLSVKTSADGIALARDSLVFCSAIEGGWDEKTINEFFRGLLKIATSAYGRARVCEEHFRDIRSNIARVSDCYGVSLLDGTLNIGRLVTMYRRRSKK